MINQKNELSKRDFLQALGLIGGSAVMYTAMQGLDMAHASAMTSPPKLSTDGNGKKTAHIRSRPFRLNHCYRNDKKGL